MPLRLAAAMLTLAAAALPAVAQELVAVTIVTEPAFEGEAIAWSAVPIEGSTEAEEAIAIPEAIVGPWQTAMEPGRWLVEGFTEELYFNGTITVGEEDVTRFEIPAIDTSGGGE